MSTPTGIQAHLDQLHLASAVTAYGDLHQDQAHHQGDDQAEDDWLWVGATGHRLHHYLDELALHLAKLGVT